MISCRQAGAAQFGVSRARSTPTGKRCLRRSALCSPAIVTHMRTNGRRVQDRRTLDARGYHEMLTDCIFIPCPMGNTTVETQRLYEALERGAIPIVPRRLLIDYYARLMPGHPLPTFPRWSDARDFVKAVSRDKGRIDRMQAEISHWWARYKSTLRKKIRDFVDAAAQRAGVNSPALADWNFRTDYAFQARRMAELIRHSTFGSLKERAAVTMSRIGSRVTKRSLSDRELLLNLFLSIQSKSS